MQLCQAAVQEINTDGNKALETLPSKQQIELAARYYISDAHIRMPVYMYM